MGSFVFCCLGPAHCSVAGTGASQQGRLSEQFQSVPTYRIKWTFRQTPVSRKPPIGYHLVKLEHELTSYVCKTCNRPYISATIIGEWREEDTWFKNNSLRLLSLPGCHDVANVRKQAVLKEHFTIKTIISVSVTYPVSPWIKVFLTCLDSQRRIKKAWWIEVNRVNLTISRHLLTTSQTQVFFCETIQHTLHSNALVAWHCLSGSVYRSPTYPLTFKDFRGHIPSNSRTRHIDWDTIVECKQWDLANSTEAHK